MDEARIVELHGEQMWGPYPYRVHLENVAAVAALLDPSPSMRELALSHDLLEDTEVEETEVSPEFLPSLRLLARNHSQGKRTYHEYIAWLVTQGDLRVLQVKFSDGLVNWVLCKREGSSLIRRYERSLPALWASMSPEPFTWEALEVFEEVLVFPF